MFPTKAISVRLNFFFVTTIILLTPLSDSKIAENEKYLQLFREQNSNNKNTSDVRTCFHRLLYDAGLDGNASLKFS